MGNLKIGLLHPGAMGVSVGAAATQAGHQVYWVAEGRSLDSQQRAADGGFRAVTNVAELVTTVDHIVSVCPPAIAVAVAQQVMDEGFTGIYVDGNAIAPATALTVAEIVGDEYVDGGIIGPPATMPGTTRMYVSGDRSAKVVQWFDGGLLDVRSIGTEPAAASALKMCYAAYTKGHSALLLSVRALAESLAVTPALLAEWGISQQGLAKRVELAAKATAPKAWRFVGEMEEIAATFEAANLPGGFHQAAATIYTAMENLQNVSNADLDDVLGALVLPKAGK